MTEAQYAVEKANADHYADLLIRAYVRCGRNATPEGAAELRRRLDGIFRPIAEFRLALNRAAG